ncbi:MAG: FecCD family ABC transporter permease, partial [Thermodesulfobacteriota bacterium]
FIALTTLVLSISNVWSMREMLFWLMGGVDSRTWAHFHIAFFPIILSSAVLLCFGKDLNLMLLGEDSAKTLGINPHSTLIVLTVLCSVIVGASVSVSGVIGFVGLVVPHVIRITAGVDHRKVLPLSFFAGAIFLPIADLFARTVIKPQELRLGVVTSLIGVPFFILLLRRSILKYGKF